MSRNKYEPEFRFVLVDKVTGYFPKMYSGFVSLKQLTSKLDETYIFDDRDDKNLKISFYNVVYKGIAEFDVVIF